MWGYAGLTTAYVLIAAMLLWLFINSRTHLVAKVLLVPVVLWYGIVLYYTPSNLMGWPTSIASEKELPGDAFVVSIQIKEPSKKKLDPGAIFITVIELGDKPKVKLSVNPKAAFTYNGHGEPRTFKVPYSKELHKKILEAEKKRRGSRGSRIKTAKKIKKGKKGTVGDGESKSKEMFRIVNPIDLMPKE